MDFLGPIEWWMWAVQNVSNLVLCLDFTLQKESSVLTSYFNKCDTLTVFLSFVGADIHRGSCVVLLWKYTQISGISEQNNYDSSNIGDVANIMIITLEALLTAWLFNQTQIHNDGSHPWDEICVKIWSFFLIKRSKCDSLDPTTMSMRRTRTPFLVPKQNVNSHWNGPWKGRWRGNWQRNGLKCH